MRRAPQNRRFGAPRKPPEEPPRSGDPFAFLFGRDMWLGGGIVALGAVCVANSVSYTHLTLPTKA